MPLTQSEREGHVLLQVSGGLTIFQAAEYKPQLLHAIDGADAMLELDLNGVDELDTAGLQLLFLLKREADAQYKRLHISGVSAEVQDVFDMLRLQAHFGVAASAGREAV